MSKRAKLILFLYLCVTFQLWYDHWEDIKIGTIIEVPRIVVGMSLCAFALTLFYIFSFYAEMLIKKKDDD